MSNENNHNSNDWVQLTQDNFFEAFQQQDQLPEDYDLGQSYDTIHGYLPVQEYTPSGSQDGYSDSSDSYLNTHNAHHAQQTNVESINDNAIPEQEVRNDPAPRRRRRTRAQPKGEQPKSQRAKRREEVALENNGEVSSKDSPKGLVEWREGVFFWFDPEDQEFKQAAYHDEYRDVFIREDAAVGEYVVAPARGKSANDITTPCSSFNQLEWRLNERESWGNIVDSDGQKIMYLLDRPPNQQYDMPQRLWIQDGLVLLDGDK